VDPGYGIDALVETCRREVPERTSTWPTSDDAEEDRAMLRYRIPEPRP
jgi:hypothetical protein